MGQLLVHTKPRNMESEKEDCIMMEASARCVDDVLLAERIAAFKSPRYIWFQTEPLPRNASGKFLKRELRELLDPAQAV